MDWHKGKKMDFQISVIIPTYNREKTIERAIRSVYAQTVLPLEVIIIDDSSNDSTVEIVEWLQAIHDTLKIYTQTVNRGAQYARNVGIKEAKGNWIAFLDSDDEWLPDKLETQLEEIKKNPGCRAIFCDGYTAFGNALRYRRCGNISKRSYGLKDILSAEVLFQSMIVRKDVLMKIGYLDNNVPAYQEVDTKIRISNEADFVYIPKPVFKYHMHSGETISKNGKRNADGYRYVILKNAKLISSHSDVDIVEIYLDGIEKRVPALSEKFVYRGLLSIYRLHRESVMLKKWLFKLMELEFKYRYERHQNK